MSRARLSSICRYFGACGSRLKQRRLMSGWYYSFYSSLGNWCAGRLIQAHMEAIGWIATAVFSTSYFFREQAVLRRIQAAAACLWIAYGVALHARPVVIANLIVAAAALYSARRRGLP